ncbi:hypothetical protein Rhopal_000184-T1 [Rhodotorula paludigena]|uniref:Alpha/beta hydrolase fold-3 domain-containing protein n=1 Tax=Rhodotorula paludigena TaxID=86838 RepID=A0AAV5GBL6_9BASI|nr:hypothetical protein Rhopal_000184-T1 [Rhodotorula paludigena]
MALWPFSWGQSTSAAPTTASRSPASPPTTAQNGAATAGGTTRHVAGPGGATDKDAPEGAEAQTALASWAALLEPFTSGGGALPEKARTDPRVRQRLAQPTVQLWQYLPFFARQGTSLTRAFFQHHLYGPPKPSWGVELTLFTTFLREVSSYSHLSSLARLRSVLELGSLLPTPKDGIVTPISFKVKKRNLRGILASYDAEEDGTREISGEWVTNKRLWRRMTREWTLSSDGDGGGRAGGIGSSGGRPTGASKDGLVCLYLHGGAYYMFSAETHRYLTISVSRYCEARVFAINYRLAPETRFPGQLHDAVSAYMRLTVDLKIPPENIIFAGDSAGGGLTLATLMYLRDEGYPLPAGAIVMSPWVDLTMSCESWTTNRPYDYLPSPGGEDDHLHPVKCLLGDTIDEYLTHPYVSPLFGKFEGLPPLLVQAGDAEVLRDEITLLAHKAALAGVKVEHEIFEDCVHVFQAFLFLEASRKAFQSQRAFVKHTLPRLRRKAAASATSSRAATPSAGTRPQATTTADFDFAEVDREVAADAHEVDESGKAEKASLPPTPQTGRGGAALPDEDEEDDLVLSDGEQLTDSSATPPWPSPSLGAPAEWGTPREQAEQSPVQLAPTPSGLPLSVASPTLPSPATIPSPTSVVSEEGTASVSSQASSRPRLRAYKSARDLSMSTLRATHSISSPTSATAALPSQSALSANGAAASSDHARKRRSATLVTTPLTSRSIGERPRALHARSSSHPDVQDLLRSYMEDQGPLRAKTRVYGAQPGADDAVEDELMSVE